MHIRDQKATLRLAIKERIEKYPEHKRHAESRTVCREILKLLPSGSDFSVAAYFPLKDEVDVRPLLQELLERGVALYLPRFDQKHFSYRRMRDLATLLPGALRIPEPPEEAEILDPKLLDFALIPARAYTKTGERLGRGNGGYDLWIRDQRAQNPHTRIYGVALECQILQEVPMEEHDETVDSVITARGLLM